MPELPEVESVRLGLQAHVRGAKIVRALQFHPRALSSESIAPLASLDDCKITNVQRRGKFLWLVMDKKPLVLVAHLGMSGQFRIEDVGQARHPHCRARFRIKQGRRESFLSFHDQRTFGWLRVDELSKGIPSSISHIALDPFDEKFDRKMVIKKLQAKRTEIKRALLDQNLMSGVGNIYADEALWRAQIHPRKMAEKLSEKELATLLTAVSRVMKRSLKAGGTSFDDLYTNVNGESGYFENSLEVYGREDDECSRCGHLIKRIKFTNRSSHFCPHCQLRR